MKILYIGTPHTYQLYKEGKNPSHWLYGAVEMEKDGHQVIWEKETANLLNDIRLIRKCHPDLIFIPNLNIGHHFLLLFLRRIYFIKRPIVAYLHRTPKSGKTGFIYSFLLKALNHCFFLSAKTMEETIQGGYLSRNKCSEPGWGPDTEFYDKIPKSNGDYFISTGKENRDFDLLIDVFKETEDEYRYRLHTIVQLLYTYNNTFNDRFFFSKECLMLDHLKYKEEKIFFQEKIPFFIRDSILKLFYYLKKKHLRRAVSRNKIS